MALDSCQNLVLERKPRSLQNWREGLLQCLAVRLDNCSNLTNAQISTHRKTILKDQPFFFPFQMALMISLVWQLILESVYCLNHLFAKSTNHLTVLNWKNPIWSALLADTWQKEKKLLFTFKFFYTNANEYQRKCKWTVIREKILSYLYKTYQTWYGHVRCEGKNSEIAVNLVINFASVSRVLIERKLLRSLVFSSVMRSSTLHSAPLCAISSSLP